MISIVDVIVDDNVVNQMLQHSEAVVNAIFYLQPLFE
jgi:hypothetical protein